ncbi:MAG: prepilin peptidase [Paracoccaceae bacterium]
MSLTYMAALWFIPFVLPICFYVIFTDMREMRITNQAVILLALVFVVIGPFALPFDVYLWRLLNMFIVLIAGIILNAAGAMGAGDSKFIAAAAPYVALGDLRLLMGLFSAALLGAFFTHQGIKRTPLRNVAPHWISWERSKFPMGLALGFSLSLYLGLGLFFGAAS